MTLNEIEKLIDKFLTKSINEEELHNLSLWINESDENKKYVQDCLTIHYALNPALNVGEINSEEALQNIIEEISEEYTLRFKVIDWWKKIAAILIIPIIGWTLYSTVYKTKINDKYIAYQEVISPSGTKSNIVLPDGSNVWLNSGSKLKFPLHFTSSQRNVYLSGEGFFKVASDKKHPFIVHTKCIDVKATGTEFNVDAYDDDTITYVALKEGIVDILAGKEELQKMQPDDNFIFNRNKNTYQLLSTNTSAICAWKDGILAFRDEPLENVFKRISRTYNVDIEIKDKKVASQLYRATFEKESLDEILRLLQISTPIKYKRTQRKFTSDNEFSKEKIEVYKK